MPPNDPQDADFSATLQDGELALSGALIVWTLPSLPQDEPRRIDASGLTRMDTAGAWYLAGQKRRGAEVTGLSEHNTHLLETVAASMEQREPDAAPPRGLRHALDVTGRKVVGALIFLRELSEYLGRFIAALLRAIRHPRDFRLTSMVHHSQETGLKAVPIVFLMAFLIGVVLAFQGATQLKQFGAEVFVVDLIAIAVLRELGILLTAIVVAGRTASALTASIGSMKMREEIDAMRTLGMDPDMVLVLPRVLALIVTLPILGLIADVAGLLGGAIMSWIELGISPSMFLSRLGDINVKHAVVGLVKAPVFALVIGVVGCHAGMKVGKDAESLGSQTSRAVVNAIFAVIVIDALFSVFFAMVGL